MIKAAEAGRRGEKVKADAWVRVEPKTEAGLVIEVKAKGEPMGIEQIRALTQNVLQSLEVTNAAVTVEDAGAVEFVLAARIEAAVKRAGLGQGKEFLPTPGSGFKAATTRERFRRSRIYLPGNEPRFLLNPEVLVADAVILDLEDSVAPAEKDAARIMVRNALRCIDFGKAERMVRINQGERGLADLDAVVPQNIHVILIPKEESADHVQEVDMRAEQLRKAAGLSNPCFLMPIIESGMGCFQALPIATATPNVVALTIGLEDYTADIGAQRTLEGRESFWARSVIVNAARAAGVTPIDTVFSDVNDMEGLRAAVLEAKGLGFEGKGCIHPKQIAVVHDAFAPTPEEIDKARKIVAAFEDAQKRGLGAVALGSKMIDAPIVKRAVRTVRMADALIAATAPQ
jgi:citrate lyase subunit beta / citryl-CoA lyase